MTMRRLALLVMLLPLSACGPSAEERQAGVAAFATVQAVRVTGFGLTCWMAPPPLAAELP